MCAVTYITTHYRKQAKVASETPTAINKNIMLKMLVTLTCQLFTDMTGFQLPFCAPLVSFSCQPALMRAFNTKLLMT
jgi:hypothetical protein